MIGDEADLGDLVSAFAEGEIRVLKTEDGYFVTSSQFDSIPDPNNARDLAETMMAIVSGARRVGLNGTEPVEVGNGLQIDADGRKHYTLFADPGTIRLRGVPATLGALLTNEATEDIEVPVREWALVALREAAVAKVFRINASPPLDWFDLYRILEIVGDDIGDVKVIEARGWMPRGSVDLFRWTANSSEVLGLDARHGVQHHDSPPNPMPLGQARTLIRILTWHWLLTK